MWKWLSEKSQMPKFVWFGVLFILIAIGYQIFRAQHLLINLSDRSIEVARREKDVAEKEKRVVEIADRTINHLEEFKKTAPTPEARDKFAHAQHAIRDDVKNPLMRTKLTPPEELFKHVRDGKRETK